jgi:hypothetical protein
MKRTKTKQAKLTLIDRLMLEANRLKDEAHKLRMVRCGTP